SPGKVLTTTLPSFLAATTSAAHSGGARADARRGPIAAVAPPSTAVWSSRRRLRRGPTVIEPPSPSPALASSGRTHARSARRRDRARRDCGTRTGPDGRRSAGSPPAGATG